MGPAIQNESSVVSPCSMEIVRSRRHRAGQQGKTKDSVDACAKNENHIPSEFVI
jgi:hypothetical protein